MARDLTVLIMAAGHGTRMRSSLPKVLHPVCGRPMVEWVVEAARAAGAERVVCITRPGEGVAERLNGTVEIAEQVEGEGTGSAVLAARAAIEASRTVLVLSGDHPLVSAELVSGLAAAHERAGAAATLLTTDRLDPTGYGRVVRAADGTVERIVETKHAEDVPPEELAIREINIGTYAFDAADLLDALDTVGEERGERYLTAVIPILRDRGRTLAAHATDDLRSAMGVNTRADLLDIERLARAALVERHATNGVTFTAPDTVAIDAGVTIGPDTTIGPGVTLRGATTIGGGCQIGPQATIADSRIGDRVTLLHAVLTEAEVGDEASVGPFAYLRPGARLAEGSKVGTYVEIKNSNIGPGAKVPHLSYVGDADIGAGTNLGASTITANYDGRRKHRTTVGEGVKTGIHTSLVAPVNVGDRAYTGAGAVIREDVPPGNLGVSSGHRQRNIERTEEDQAE
ncbi:MAG: bifunctional UDP-N-acetylglucosamine diphosphorylase/glucosamine-1-phosphate N-acetyltransferase GlmU [Actinomycetota bacterium]|nr:bifunctional UDP-N-acetylglucosamine diphosphorylase/glucosamine-1-phosphate N-acetyltransferase GlmU [Actinomycetota bacterium]